MGLTDPFGLLSNVFKVLVKRQADIRPEAYGIGSKHLIRLILWLSDTWNLCFVLGWLPLAWLLGLMASGDMGGNPIEAFHLYTGLWAVRFLCITLLVTPVQILTEWRGMVPFRQLFGLMAFFYASLHVVGYLYLDHGLRWGVIARDIRETPYLWPGILTFLILLLLALTSPKAGKKLLGKHWKRLHRWIYAGSVAAIVHYVMQLKGNLADPLLYGLLLMILLAFRFVIWIRNHQVARLMIPRRRRLDEDG